MFGERRNSILPIISELTSVVKRNMVEQSDPVVNVAGNNRDADKKNDETDEQHESFELHRTKRSSKYVEDDRLSYHERKLNMTNFRGTAETNDQHAIESETRVHVSLPNSNVSSPMSLEEIENLAFKDLNGTSSIAMDSNTTNTESLPEPEMLIRPYRVRPRPLSERFDNIYLYVVDYPMWVYSSQYMAQVWLFIFFFSFDFFFQTSNHGEY